MNTYCEVDYSLLDVTALEDAVESAGENSDFASLQLIKNDVKAPRYGTLEHNFFSLGGECEQMPDEPDNLAYFSSVQSDNNGTFGEPPSIIINFSENHLSSGLTLKFLENYPIEIKVHWYDLYDNEISVKTFYPDSLVYYCENLQSYGKIKIVFTRLMPFRNVKLQYIAYGLQIHWSDEDIKSGKITSMVDPISDKIKTNTLEFSIVDKDGKFDMTNAGSIFRAFQRSQSMTAYEYVDGEKILLGAYFLDEALVDKNIVKLSAVDYNGILSNTDFIDGKMYDGVPAGDIIAEIMESAGIDSYSVDDDTSNELVYGTIPIKSCQIALREVLFATGSIALTQGRTSIDIIKIPQAPDNFEKITKSRKFETKVTEESYISDVVVKYKEYALDEKESELVKGTYGAGMHQIRFSDPSTDIRTSAGIIVANMPYYVVLDLESESEVVVYGKRYKGNDVSASASIKDIKSGELRSSKTFSGTLLNYETASSAAWNILGYYQMQKKIKTKHLSGHEMIGDWVEIENPNDQFDRIFGIIESASVDLTGGYICNADLRGYLDSEVQ